MIGKKVLNQLKKVLAQQPIKLAYLYGSAARGQEHKKSDIDIAVVLKNPEKDDFFKIAAQINLAIKGIEVDVREISFQTEPVFLRSILKDRMILLMENEKERIGFETQAMKRFFDTEHLRKLNYYYLKKSLKEGTYGRGPQNFRKITE